MGFIYLSFQERGASPFKGTRLCEHNLHSDLEWSFAPRSSKVSSPTPKTWQLKWAGDRKSPDGVTFIFQPVDKLRWTGTLSRFIYFFILESKPPPPSTITMQAAKVSRSIKSWNTKFQLPHAWFTTASVRKFNKLFFCITTLLSLTIIIS